MLYFDEVILSLKLYRDKVADEKREPGVRVEYVVTRSETLLTVCVARRSSAIIVNAYQPTVTNFAKQTH